MPYRLSMRSAGNGSLLRREPHSISTALVEWQ